MCNVCVMAFLKHQLMWGGGTDCSQMVKAATRNGRIIYMHLRESAEEFYSLFSKVIDNVLPAQTWPE